MLTNPKVVIKNQLIEYLINNGWKPAAVQAYCRALPEVITRSMYEFQKQAFLDCVMVSGEQAVSQMGNYQSKVPKQAKMGRMPVPA